MLKQNASKIAILLEYENSYSFFSVFLFRALMNAPALCDIWAHKLQKRLQKTWSNLTFSTIHTCEALIGYPKPTVQIWRNILDLQKNTIFGEKFCPALPAKLGNPRIRRDSVSHWYLEFNWDVKKSPGPMKLAFTCILGLEDHPKLIGIHHFFINLALHIMLYLPRWPRG